MVEIDGVRGLGIGLAGIVLVRRIGISRMLSHPLGLLFLVYRARSRRFLSRVVSILLAGDGLWLLLSTGWRVILAERMD